MGRLVVKAVKADDLAPEFTIDEKELFNRVRLALFAAGRTADAEALARAITSLDPQELERALRTISVAGLEDIFVEAIERIIAVEGEATARSISPVVERTERWGGPTTITGTPDIEYRFDRTDPLMQRMARTQAARLVTSIDESMRLAVRQVITRAFTNQISVDYTARRLRNVIGLHPRWALAVDKYFDRQYQRLLKEGLTGPKAMERAQMVTDTYRRRLIRARATMVARTEIQIAQNMGRQVAWTQSVTGGWVQGDSMKEWVSTGRSASGIVTCDECRSMDGMKVKWNQAFPNGVMMPPAHPHCRCTAVLLPPDRGLGDDEWIRTGVQPEFAPLPPWNPPGSAA